MTTASEIVTRAYRETNTIAVGKSPTTAEVSEALPLLNTIIQNIFGRTLGNYTEDWPLGTFFTAPEGAQFPFWPNDYKPTQDVWGYPPPNSRLVTRLSAPTTIYFDAYPDDGAQMILVDNANDWVTNPLTIDFNGRTGRTDAASTDAFTTYTISEAPASSLHWIYRADLSQWVLVPSTTVGTEIMPLPTEFDDWFSIALAMRLAPRYSKQIDQMLAVSYSDLSKQMTTRYKQSPRIEVYRRGENQNTVQTLTTGSYDGRSMY